ncbi:hypothetical protein AAMO2058_001248300 [Amorphochlora amoebiformis]
MPALWSVAKACFFGGLVGFMVRGYMSKEVEGKILGESKKSKEKIASKTEMYAKLAKRVEAFLSTSDDPVSLLSNTAALIYHELQAFRGGSDPNWSGFYIARTIADSKEKCLILGPFHGNPVKKYSHIYI